MAYVRVVNLSMLSLALVQALCAFKLCRDRKMFSTPAQLTPTRAGTEATLSPD